MEIFKRQWGVPYARTMIFPENIGPTDTLALLKEYNFQGTITRRISRQMASETRAGVPICTPPSWSIPTSPCWAEADPKSEPYPFDFFIGQPVLRYTHKDSLQLGINAFDPTADYINSLQGKVEWQSIDSS